MKIKLSEIDLGTNVSRFQGVDDIESLANSLKTRGQICPICVRKEGDRYLLEVGFRRFAAAQLLNWVEIDAVESSWTKKETGLANLAENIDRKGLSFFEEATAIEALFPGDVSISKIAKEVGKSRSWVRPRKLLWTLSEEIQEKCRLKELTPVEVSSILRGVKYINGRFERELTKACKPSVKTIRTRAEILTRISDLVASGECPQQLMWVIYE